MKGSMKKLVVVVVIAAIGTFIVADLADAKKKNIQGIYAFTGKAICLSTIPGILNPAPDQLITPSTTALNVTNIDSQSMYGVCTINSDGTGTLHGHFVGFGYYPVRASGASKAEFKAAFKYTVSPFNNVTTVTSLTEGTIRQGIHTDKTFTCTQFSLTGTISMDGKSIMLTTNEPEIETVEYKDKYGILIPADTKDQICLRSFLLFKTPWKKLPPPLKP